MLFPVNFIQRHPKTTTLKQRQFDLLTPFHSAPRNRALASPFQQPHQSKPETTQSKSHPRYLRQRMAESSRLRIKRVPIATSRGLRTNELQTLPRTQATNAPRIDNISTATVKRPLQEKREGGNPNSGAHRGPPALPAVDWAHCIQG